MIGQDDQDLADVFDFNVYIKIKWLLNFIKFNTELYAVSYKKWSVCLLKWLALSFVFVYQSSKFYL